MADGKGECCIASWGGRHVTDRYNTSKMDMIMLKFRPIAPKPVPGCAAVSGTLEGCTQSSGSGGRHAKPAVGRGRKKTSSKENNNSSGTSSRSVRKCSSNGRKKKSSSPDNHEKNDDHDKGDQMVSNDYQKADLTLLPLFPEAPDLSPTSQVQNMVPFWLTFDNTGSSPSFEDNYSHSQQSWW